MQIVIAGGSGFLGSPLAETYAEDSHDVRVLTRGLPPGESRHESGTGVPGITRVGWSPDGQAGPWAAAIDGADAVINLAGASIGAKRWTPQRKAELRDSRILRDPQPRRGDRWARRRRRASSSARSASATTAPPTATPKTESVAARRRLPGAPLRGLGGRGAQGRARRHPRSSSSAAASSSSDRAARCAQMMTPFRFFAGGPIGLGPPVHVVDSPPRLDRDGAVDRADARSRRAGQRHRAAPGHEPRVRARARPLAEAPRARAGARLRAEARRSASSPTRRSPASGSLPRTRRRSGITSGIRRSISRSGESLGTNADSSKSQLPSATGASFRLALSSTLASCRSTESSARRPGSPRRGSPPSPRRATSRSPWRRPSGSRFRSARRRRCSRASGCRASARRFGGGAVDAAAHACRPSPSSRRQRRGRCRCCRSR